MSDEYLTRLLLDFAVLMGWFALIPMAVARHSHRRMKASPMAATPPLRSYSRRFWQQDFRYWDNLAFAMASFSLLCLLLHLLA
jgi:hypothetical protein